MLLNKIRPVFSRIQTSQRINHYYFTNLSKIEPKIMSFDESNAELSFGIIRIISQREISERFKAISLTQRILNYIEKNSKVCEESKNEISSLFTSGIDISEDQEIFSQLKIKNGRYSERKIEKSKNERESSGNETLKFKKLFIFHPTYMVTGRIFREFDKGVLFGDILTGEKGISKTVSAYLYWKLTRYIDKYRFNREEKVNEIYYSIPKVFYWNISEKMTIEEVTRNILEQVESEFLVCNENYENKIKNLRDFYKRFNEYLEPILIIDQIEPVVEQQESYENLLYKLEKTINELEKLEISIDYLANIKKTLDKILPEFREFIYISSKKVEYSVSITLDLSRSGKHEHSCRISILYRQFIDNEDNMNELINYFIFEFEQRVLKEFGYELEEESLKKELSKKCFEYLNEIKDQFYFTPYSLRLKIEKNKREYFTRLRKLEDEQEKLEFIFDRFKYLVEKMNKKLVYSPREHESITYKLRDGAMVEDNFYKTYE